MCVMRDDALFRIVTKIFHDTIQYMIFNFGTKLIGNGVIRAFFFRLEYY